jgi:hypothetical protein
VDTEGNALLVEHGEPDEFDERVVAAIPAPTHAADGSPVPPLRNNPTVTEVDRREIKCLLCGERHSDDFPLPGPLLGPHPLRIRGKHGWVHDECARWSPQVFENGDGGWCNIAKEVARGRQLKCACCKRIGASIGCNRFTCQQSYHYKCAVATGWTFTVRARTWSCSTTPEVVVEGHHHHYACFESGRRL